MVHIVFNFFQILISVHRLHGCEERWLPVPSEAFSCPLLTKESISWAFPSLPPECPWIDLFYRKCLEELGFKHNWNIFFCPPPFAKRLTQASTVHPKVPTKSTLKFSIMSSNLTAPSSSRGTDSLCRNNLIMIFLLWRIYWYHSQYEPKKLFGLWTIFRSW